MADSITDQERIARGLTVCPHMISLRKPVHRITAEPLVTYGVDSKDHNMPASRFTPFALDLARRIQEFITEERTRGTVSIGRDCLFQCVRPPSRNLAGSPEGTNARYYYRELFNEVCDSLPDNLRNFIEA